MSGDVFQRLFLLRKASDSAVISGIIILMLPLLQSSTGKKFIFPLTAMQSTGTIIFTERTGAAMTQNLKQLYLDQ